MRCDIKNYYAHQVILLTGAASGIGEDLAECLALCNAKLILLDRNWDQLQKVSEKCQKMGAFVIPYQVDVSDESTMQHIAKEILSRFQHIDLIIANAGIGGLNPADNFNPAIAIKMMQVNYFGMIYSFAPFLPLMLKRKQGHLVGVSSQAAYRGLPHACSYSASKSAQMKFLESFRVDLKKYGISVTSVHPGFVKTHMTQHQEFQMPFMVSKRKSSLIILRGIKNKRSRINYPFRMYLLNCLNRVLPDFLYDYLLPRLSRTLHKKAKAQIF